MLISTLVYRLRIPRTHCFSLHSHWTAWFCKRMWPVHPLFVPHLVNIACRENELLKHQLRKYVSAVQMLRSQAAKGEGELCGSVCRRSTFPVTRGVDWHWVCVFPSTGNEVQGIHLEDIVQPAMPPPKPIDYSHEASEYERKLIQVKRVASLIINIGL